jgi:DNA-directed RNA polymerase specialized sigma24 family protein
MTTHDGQFGSDSDVEHVPSPERSHEARLSSDQLQRVLKQLVSALPRKRRDPLLLAGSGEHSYDEIGTSRFRSVR